MGEPREPAKPPWEAELEAEVLAELRSLQTTEAQLDRAEAEALRKVEHEQIVAEFDALLASRKDELAALRNVRTGTSRLISGSLSREAEAAAVVSTELKHRDPWRLIIWVVALCAALLFAMTLLTRELGQMSDNYEQGARETFGLPE